MLAKLVSGAQQVRPDPAVGVHHRGAGQARSSSSELDWSKVPNLKNIAPGVQEPAARSRSRSTRCRGWPARSASWSTPRRSRTPIKGYKDVFQEKYKGRIVVLDDPREIVTLGARDARASAPTTSPRRTSTKVKPVLAKWLPLVKVYDSDSPKTALLNGDVDLGIVWSGEAALLYNEDKKFQYVLPVEGAHMFIDSLAIPTNAPNPEAAHAFMNYILRPEVSRS